MRRPFLAPNHCDSLTFAALSGPGQGLLSLPRRLRVPKQLPGDDNVGRMQFLLALRKRGISDPAVLRAMDEVPREHFVESSFVPDAYADQALPIACGQT